MPIIINHSVITSLSPPLITLLYPSLTCGMHCSISLFVPAGFASSLSQTPLSLTWIYLAGYIMAWIYLCSELIPGLLTSTVSLCAESSETFKIKRNALDSKTLQASEFKVQSWKKRFQLSENAVINLMPLVCSIQWDTPWKGALGWRKVICLCLALGASCPMHLPAAE